MQHVPVLWSAADGMYHTCHHHRTFDAHHKAAPVATDMTCLQPLLQTDDPLHDHDAFEGEDCAGCNLAEKVSCSDSDGKAGTAADVTAADAAAVVQRVMEGM